MPTSCSWPTTWPASSGPLLSPDFALDALVPCYHAIAAEVVGGGAHAAFHSDGDIRVLMPALARAGFSAVHLAGLPATRSRHQSMRRAMPDSHPSGVSPPPSLATILRRSVGMPGDRHADRGLVVCDDGGLASAADIAAYRVAVETAREAFGGEQNHG